MIKYMLHPGMVISRTDRDKHYISARKLIELYNLNRNECVIYDIDKPYPGGNKLIHLISVS